MHVAFIAPECDPLVKTGGLGEVLGALPTAIAGLGHRVTVYVPFYRAVRVALERQPDPMAPPVILQSVTVPFASRNYFVRVLDGGRRHGVETCLVDCPLFFERDGVYGPPGENYPDNALRYGLFCRAVLESAKLLGVPDVFHLHDWQAAFVAIFLHSTYATDPLLATAATVFTIHNGAYQGLFPPEQLHELLLPADLISRGGIGSRRQVNPFLGALRYSDGVTTVSPTYAEELKTPPLGEGLEADYRARGKDFSGILNGINLGLWNPSHDPNLAAHYSADDLSGKEECRRDLLRAFGLHDLPDGTAVIGIVSRLAAQKGFDLIAEAWSRLAKLDLLMLILGKGEPEVESKFRALSVQYPHRLRLGAEFYDSLAHKMQAGSDMTLMPSRYEPAGLSQLYSLHYGTVPVVRSTGGLRDSVQDGPEGNGFTFHDYTADALVGAVERALAEFADRGAWHQRMRRCMEADLSWAKPARAYEAVYERAMAVRAARTRS